MKAIKILRMSVLIILSGCSFTPYTTDFQCPLGKGVPCKRLSSIHRMIDQGAIGMTHEIHRGLMCHSKGCLKEGRAGMVPHITYFEKEKSS